MILCYITFPHKYCVSGHKIWPFMNHLFCPERVPNHFMKLAPFYTPLKTPESHKLSDLFRVIEREKWGEINMLIKKVNPLSINPTKWSNTLK